MATVFSKIKGAIAQLSPVSRLPTSKFCLLARLQEYALQPRESKVEKVFSMGYLAAGRFVQDRRNKWLLSRNVSGFLESARHSGAGSSRTSLGSWR